MNHTQLTKNPRNAGFTLVELLIGISLVALIALSGIPYTSSWTDGSNLQATEGALNEGFSRAKSIAMRNLFATQGENAASALCLSNTNLLTLHVATPTDSAACDTTQIWTFQLPENTTLTVDSAALTHACFNNKGQPTQTGVDCAAGAANTNISITAGSKNATVSYL